nr:hypothetical protein [Streptomyces sp. SID8381]
MLDPPARRRRHARLIAALTSLIGACAAAAGDVYDPIARAAPGQTAVPVSLLQCVQLSLSGPLLLDVAVQEDAARWPEAVQREQAAARRTFGARCAGIELDRALDGAAPAPQSAEEVPVPTVPQAAAGALIEAGHLVCEQWAESPEQAVALVKEIIAEGEFTASEILDEAVDCAAGAGALALDGVRSQSDPSMAAERCLLAVRYFALAVSLASADLDDITGPMPDERPRGR